MESTSIIDGDEKVSQIKLRVCSKVRRGDCEWGAALLIFLKDTFEEILR